MPFQLAPLQHGHSEMATIELAGVFHLDVMSDIKKAHALDTYSLDACAAALLPAGEKKIDLRPQDQFNAWKANDVITLLLYCIKDVRLTYDLAEKLSCLPSVLENAAIAGVTPTIIATRGQQIRVFTCIRREIVSRGANLFMRDTRLDPTIEGGYKGATVLEPKKGFYPR